MLRRPPPPRRRRLLVVRSFLAFLALRWLRLPRRLQLQQDLVDFASLVDSSHGSAKAREVSLWIGGAELHGMRPTHEESPFLCEESFVAAAVAAPVLALAAVKVAVALSGEAVSLLVVLGRPAIVGVLQQTYADDAQLVRRENVPEGIDPGEILIPSSAIAAATTASDATNT